MFAESAFDVSDIRFWSFLVAVAGLFITQVVRILQVRRQDRRLRTKLEILKILGDSSLRLEEIHSELKGAKQSEIEKALYEMLVDGTAFAEAGGTYRAHWRNQKEKRQLQQFSTVPKVDELVESDTTVADDHMAFIESMALDLYDLPDWRSADSLLKLKQQINDAHPRRKKDKDGDIGDERHCPNANHTGSSDHCLNIVDGDERIVTALDVTHDPAECDVGKIVNAIWTSKDSRIKYIIWNRQICNSSAIGDHAPWTWRTYSGTNPHTGHAHFSVKKAKTKYDDKGDWAIGS